MMGMNREGRMICLSNCINRDSCGMMQRGDNPPVTLSPPPPPTFLHVAFCFQVITNSEGEELKELEPHSDHFSKPALSSFFWRGNFFKLLDSNEQKLTILSL